MNENQTDKNINTQILGVSTGKCAGRCETGKWLNFVSGSSASLLPGSAPPRAKSPSLRFNFQFSTLSPSRFNLMALPPL